MLFNTIKTTMPDNEIETTIRSHLLNKKGVNIESLLVQCSDWGINIRMFLDRRPVELDIVKNYEGYEVTFVDDPNREPVQIDDIEDLVSTLNITAR